MRWEDLDKAIASEQWASALDISLDGWRQRRVAILAELVDVMAKKLGPPEPLVASARDSSAFQKAWLERVREAKPATIEAALSSLTRVVPMPTRYFWERGTAPVRFASWFERLDALATLPDDPRIAHALFFEAIRKAPYGSFFIEDTAAIYDRGMAIITKTADERLLASMRALLETPAAKRAVMRQYLEAELPNAIQAIERRRNEQRPLSDEEIRGATRIIEEHRPPDDRAKNLGTDEKATEATLLDLVVESPDDDAPRAVIADWWLERGDPRGELVSLQLDEHPGEAEMKRARALLREHEKRWCGDLALVTSNRIFRRGFLDEITLLNNAVAAPQMWEASALSPALRTVREIHKGRANETHYRRFLFSPMAASLRRVAAVTKAMLRAVSAREDPWTITELETTFMPAKKDLDVIAASTAFPQLQGFVTTVSKDGAIHKVIELLRVFSKERGLRGIAIRPDWQWKAENEPATWLASITDALPHLEEVELRRGNQRLIARRGNNEGVHLELIADRLYHAHELLARVETLVPIEKLSLAFAEDGRDITTDDVEVAKKWIRHFEGKLALDATWAKKLA